MHIKNDKTSEALLVIVTGFIVLFLIFVNSLFVYISVVVGVSGIFIKPLGRLISKAWFLIGELMGFFVSKVVLALLFYFFLTPIAILHNLFNKDNLKTKKTENTLWFNRDHHYKSSDFEKTW